MKVRQIVINSRALEANGESEVGYDTHSVGIVLILY